MEDRDETTVDEDLDTFFARTLENKVDWIMWKAANIEAVPFGISLPAPPMNLYKRRRTTRPVCA